MKSEQTKLHTKLQLSKCCNFSLNNVIVNTLSLTVTLLSGYLFAGE